MKNSTSGLLLACLVLSACSSGGSATPFVTAPPQSAFELNPSPLELTSDTPAVVITAQGDTAGVRYTPHADSACTASTGSMAIAGDGVAQLDVAGAPLIFIAVASGTPPASCTITVTGSDGSTASVQAQYSAVTLSTSVMNAAQVRRASVAQGTLSPSSISISSPTDVVTVSASGFTGATSASVSCNSPTGIGINVFPSSFSGAGTATIVPYGQGTLSGTCSVTFTDAAGAKTTLQVTLAATALKKLTVTPSNVQFSCIGSSPETCATGSVTIAEAGATKFRINNRPTLINSCANAFNGPLKMTTGNGTYETSVAGPQADVSFYGLLLAPPLGCTKIVIGDGGAQTVVVSVNQTIASGGTAAKAASCGGPDPLVAAPNAPHGIYVWNPYKVQGQYEPLIEKYVLGPGTTPIDPDICGVSLVVPWADVETSKGSFSWGEVDGWVAPYVHAGLRVNLLFADASEVGTKNTVTPGWVFSQDGVGTINCPNQVPYPNWLDPNFESDYEAFIAAAVKEFSTGGASYASHIGYLRFGIGAGAESYPGHIENPGTTPHPCLDAWAQATPAFSYNAWLTHTLNIVRYMGHLTTDKQLMISLNYVSAYDNANSNDAYTYANAVAEVAAPNHIAMGTQNLGIKAGGVAVAGASSDPHACDPTKQYTNIYWCQAYTRHLGVVPFEFQPIVSPLNPEGYDVTIAHLFEYGLDNNAQIFEIYPQDWVFKDDPAAFPTFTAATQAQYNAAFSATSLILGRNQ